MRKNKKILDTLLAVGVLIVYLSIFSCRSSLIPTEGRVSPTHSEVTGEVEFILIKKDGVTIILPTITKDTIK
tara:strand:+ start:421 stop:636 length:216 start_codon:yes stop_codon:yes gene_type:complete